MKIGCAANDGRENANERHACVYSLQTVSDVWPDTRDARRMFLRRFEDGHPTQTQMESTPWRNVRTANLPDKVTIMIN